MRGLVVEGWERLDVVICEMLAGELPLGRFPAPSQRTSVDARIDEIVFKTLEKERNLRQQKYRYKEATDHVLTFSLIRENNEWKIRQPANQP